MMRTLSPVCYLLADDLEENLLALEALLRRDDLVLLKARSGDEALELLLRHEVALALVDVQMPGLTGFELAELMRGNERTRGVPIIFITAGTADVQRRFRGYEAGAVDFIQKPIEPDVLRSKAEVFFKLHRQRQQIELQRDELEASGAALREAARHKDEFLATLGHELRNPLTPLRHGLDILRRRHGAPGDVEILAMMDRQMASLVRLIDDILDVSRISQGKMNLRKERTALGEILSLAVETSRPLIEAAAHELVLDLPPEPVWLEADLTRVSQIISNLLNNAAKYTESGGLIRLAARVEDDMAVITVADNGVGIPPDKLSDIFDLFAQIGDAAERARGGLGIGLALVKQLVALHGGSVTAESAGPGQGACFTLRFPRAVAPPVPEEARAEEGGTGRPLKVMVVDDSPEVAQTLGWMIEEFGHRVVLAHDGEAALEIAADFLPDAILLDLTLEGMDGYAVCEAFRQDARFADTAIIAHSGWGQDREKSRKAGFDHYLAKPASLRDLAEMLSRIGPNASVSDDFSPPRGPSIGQEDGRLAGG